MVGKLALRDEPPAIVSLRGIKEWATAELSADSALRRVLEREQETVPAGDFVVKLGVWLQLLDLEEGERRSDRH